MQNLQKDNIVGQGGQIPQKLWYNLIRKQYTIPSITLQLSCQQITKLLQQTSISQLKTLLFQSQKQQITKFISKTNSKILYLKLNNRTPKDLPYLNRQVHNVNDFLTVLHSSQYLLQTLEKDKNAEAVLREFLPQLAENLGVYEVYVRDGIVIAIGQKFCDHIEQEPSQEAVKKIISVVQQIMPAITLATPPPHPINSFIITLSLHESTPKIFSLRYYPKNLSSSPSSHSIFTASQIETYSSQIEQKQHKSQQQKYYYNQGVVPLIKTVKKQQDIKHYDMGEYLMGNEIVDQNMMGEWKQFIQETEGKMAQDKIQSKTEQKKQEAKQQ